MQRLDKTLFLYRCPRAHLLLLNFRCFFAPEKDIVCALKALSCRAEQSLASCRIGIALYEVVRVVFVHSWFHAANGLQSLTRFRVCSCTDLPVELGLFGVTVL